MESFCLKNFNDVEKKIKQDICITSTDPIDSWHRHLMSAKSNCASHDYEVILKRYLSQFFNNSQYKNDPRYVNVWLDYAETCNQPEEIFAYMKHKSIGTGCASFYITWANYCEKTGNYKRAKSLYDRGIHNLAQPLEALLAKKSAFENLLLQLNKMEQAKSSQKQEFSADEDTEKMLLEDEVFPFQESFNHQRIRHEYGESLEKIFPMYSMNKVYSHVTEFQFEEVMAARWKKLHGIDYLHTNEVNALKYGKERAEEKLSQRNNQLSCMMEAITSKLDIKLPQNVDEDITTNIYFLCSQLNQTGINVEEEDNIAKKSSCYLPNHSSRDIQSNSSMDSVSMQNTSLKLLKNAALANFPTLPERSDIHLQNHQETTMHEETLTIKPFSSSPTLCTKEAMGDIMEMFQKPLEGEINFESDKYALDNKNASFLSYLFDNEINKSSEPIQIFCDDETQNDRLNISTNKSSFKIFCDQADGSCIGDGNTNLQPCKPWAFSSSSFDKISQNTGPKIETSVCNNFIENVKVYSKESDHSSQDLKSNFEIYCDDVTTDDGSVFLTSDTVKKSSQNITGFVRGKAFNEMSETIIASQDELPMCNINGQQTEKFMAENNVLAESTSFQQLSVNNLKDGFGYYQNVEKEAKKLSPILEDTNENNSSIQQTGGSLFSHKSGCSNNFHFETESIADFIYDNSQRSSSKQSMINAAESSVNISMCNGSSGMQGDDFLLNIVEDPWNDDMRRKLAWNFLTSCCKVFTIKQKAPKLKKNRTVNLEKDHCYFVVDVIGNGGFAKIFLVSDDADNTYAVKVESPPCEWEVAIIETAIQRLQVSRKSQFKSMFIDITQAIVFNDASWIITEYISHGTLLDFVKNSASTKISPIQYCQLALQIVELVDALHSVDIIHGDVKPDNFLVCSNYQSSTLLKEVPILKLIDFGQAIDMRSFPANTAFTKCCNTSSFVCIQMKSNQPWNYHIDYFGIAGTIYLMITNSYMKVIQESNGEWKPSMKLPRWTDEMWKEIFSKLLNFQPPSHSFKPCYKTSPLPSIIKQLKIFLSSAKSV